MCNDIKGMGGDPGRIEIEALNVRAAPHRKEELVYGHLLHVLLAGADEELQGPVGPDL